MTTDLPVGTPEDILLEMRRVYEDAEESVLRSIARRLQRGIEEEGWAHAKLREIRAQQRDVERRLAQAARNRPDVAAVTDDAYRTGSNGAARNLREVTGQPVRAQLTGSQERAVERLAQATADKLERAQLQIARTAMDGYRRISVRAAAEAASGAVTRRQAAQSALNQFADSGISGFRDAAGRRWGLPEYAEMATRTTLGQAQVQGTLDRFEANDYDLVIVSVSPEPCPLCDPLEGRVYSRSGDDNRYPPLEEARAAGLWHPNCVAAGALVTGPSVVSASARWYEGEAIVIHTASGNELTVTPNHPILTSKGWVAAGLLNEGDDVIRYIGDEGMMLPVDPDNNQVPSRIEDIAGAIFEAGSVLPAAMPVTAEDFHGDGVGSNVCVVGANSLLWGDADPTLSEPIGQHRLSLTYMTDGVLPTASAVSQLLRGELLSPHSIVGLSGECLPFFGAHSFGPNLGSFGSCRRGHDASFTQPLVHGHLAYSERLSDLPFGLTGVVSAQDVVSIEGQTFILTGTDVLDISEADTCLAEPVVDSSLTDSQFLGYDIPSLPGLTEMNNIVHIERRDFADHVYNLETTEGWYACNSIITHNCTHSVGAWIPGLSREMKDEKSPRQAERYQQRQEQRRIERQIRKFKKREAVSLDEDAAKQAHAKVRAWQAQQRRFIERTDRRRLYEREQVTRAR